MNAPFDARIDAPIDVLAFVKTIEYNVDKGDGGADTRDTLTLCAIVKAEHANKTTCREALAMPSEIGPIDLACGIRMLRNEANQIGQENIGLREELRIERDMRTRFGDLVEARAVKIEALRARSAKLETAARFVYDSILASSVCDEPCDCIDCQILEALGETLSIPRIGET